MTLTFLGKTYEANICEIDSAQSNVTGRYRGAPVKFSNPHTVPCSNVPLTYRGIRYTC